MRNPFRRKREGDVFQDKEERRCEDAMDMLSVLYEEASIEVRGEANLLDVSLYETRTFSDDAAKAMRFTDALIPAAGTIAEEAAQYGQAIVKFPDGKGWSDLLGRVTPGDEGWKTLATMKNKKFDTQAMIRQAKLQPTAVANLALQGAAIVVGQTYMVEINKQLDEIASGIASIQEEMRLERESRLEAAMATLKEYAEDYVRIVADPERRQTVKNQIEGIRLEALEAWMFQVKHMEALQRAIEKKGSLKKKDLVGFISKYNRREQAARYAISLLVAADQVRIHYHQDYNEDVIEKGKKELQARLEAYSKVRDVVQARLVLAIDKLRPALLAIPEADTKDKEGMSPLQAVVETVGEQVPRLFPLVMHDEAKRKNGETKDRLRAATVRDNPVQGVIDAQVDGLDVMEFIYNDADAMVLDGAGVHFVKLRGGAEAGGHESGYEMMEQSRLG